MVISDLIGTIVVLAVAADKSVGAKPLKVRAVGDAGGAFTFIVQSENGGLAQVPVSQCIRVERSEWRKAEREAQAAKLATEGCGDPACPEHPPAAAAPSSALPS